MVRAILCVARNYAAHAAELGNAVPKAPVFFLKPPSSIVHAVSRNTNGQNGLKRAQIELPRSLLQHGEAHHEVELACVIRTDLPRGSLRSSINGNQGYRQRNSSSRVSAAAVDDALVARCVSHVCAAIDVTAREVQARAKADRLPWTVSKGIDTFCPISPLVRVRQDDASSDENVQSFRQCEQRLAGEGDLPPVVDGISLSSADLRDIALCLRVDGSVKQLGSTALMLHPIAALLRAATEFMSFKAGDLLLTGTPEGVGPMVAGNRVDFCLALRTGSLSSKNGHSEVLSIADSDTQYTVIPESLCDVHVVDVD